MKRITTLKRKGFYEGTGKISFLNHLDYSFL